MPLLKFRPFYSEKIEKTLDTRYPCDIIFMSNNFSLETIFT